MERALRKSRVGMVVSNKMDKTIVVAIEDNVKHPTYGKIIMPSPLPIFLVRVIISMNTEPIIRA